MLHPLRLQDLHTSADGTLHHAQLQSLPPDVQDHSLGSTQLASIPPDHNHAIYQRYLDAASPAQHHQLQPQHSFAHNAGLSHAHAGFQNVPPTGYSYPHFVERYGLIQEPPQRIQAPSTLPEPIHHPPPQLPHHAHRSGRPIEYVQTYEADDTPVTNHGQFEGLKLIANPPNLAEWRAKLFNVDDTITLTEDEFQTYFPHVDNVYSHRSTQRHKRKRFVSHYWDCRLKGRPPGTKKSTDPEKKKRKRVARERDLCDVKIKITEYFDASEYTEQTGQRPPVDTTLDAGPFFVQQTPTQTQAGVPPWMQNMGPPLPLPAPAPKRFYTVQRVNGNGGNGKGDGVAGPHKHTLEDSDRVKKNSVTRWMAKNEKDNKKKVQGGDSSKKTYHKKATGDALTTVKNRSKEEELKLFGSCFCPFVQRVWISLEYKGIPYQYIEVDPYKKPQSLLEINPRGLVPAIRHGPTWSTYESTVIMEYLEDLNTGPALLPSDPQTKATCRLWSDHINRHIIPSFYRLLQAQDANDQVTHATELRDEINKIVDAADAEGPFFLGANLGFVDVQMAPWVIRLRKVLGPYRGWPEPETGSRWARWVDAIENEPSVRSTTSDSGLYLDSYERYAENRPNTSLLANAVNSGRGLP